jgi:hypothetical protein
VARDALSGDRLPWFAAPLAETDRLAILAGIMETQTVEQDCGQEERRPVHRFKKGTSGNPAGTRGVKTLAAALYAELAPDFEPLDAPERLLPLQACTLSVRARRIADPDAAVRMSSEARRTIESLKRARQKSGAKPLRAGGSTTDGDDLASYMAKLPRDPRKPDGG